MNFYKIKNDDRQKMARKMRGHKVNIQATETLCSNNVESGSQILIAPMHGQKK